MLVEHEGIKRSGNVFKSDLSKANMQIKQDSILQSIENQVRINKVELSWAIGVWLGDNSSSREGSVIRNNKRSSGKFGIINNDLSTIRRFMSFLKLIKGLSKIKLDVQVPKNTRDNFEEVKVFASKTFDVEKENISVYEGSPWRRQVGYVIYVNNTALLRAIYSEVFLKLEDLILSDSINARSLIQGIADAEGHVDKANKLVGISNTNKKILEIICLCLKKLNVDYKKRVNEKNRKHPKIIVEIRDFIKFEQKIGFHNPEKEKALKELIAGRCVRNSDNKFLELLAPHLKKGMTALEVHEKLNIAHPTAKLLLRNLASANLLERKKVKRYFVYFPGRLSN